MSQQLLYILERVDEVVKTVLKESNVVKPNRYRETSNRMHKFEVIPRYWLQTNPPYEVDFLIQRENDIIPIEVKAKAYTESRSLKNYKEKFSEYTKLRVRFF